MESGERVLKLKEVIAIVGISRSSIYALVQRGDFPAPIKLSLRSCGWLKSEIDRWIQVKASSRVS